MAYSNISNLDLGTLLQIKYAQGIRQQLAQSFAEWEMIRQMRIAGPSGKQLNFMLQTGRGPAGVQWRNPGEVYSFPQAQAATVQEGSALFKELVTTATLPLHLWEQAKRSPEKYGEPLAMEIESKSQAAQRQVASILFGDGTGVVGTVASIVDVPASGEVNITVSATTAARGFIGNFEEGDILTPRQPNGTLRAPTVTGTFYGWRIKRKTRSTNVVVVEPINSSGTVLAFTLSNLVAGDLCYRVGQPSIPDLSGAVASDYGSLSEVIVGLEALSANDGRLVHGITMSGVTGGSVYDCAAAAIDVFHLHEALDAAKIRTGRGIYKYSKVVSSPEAIRSLIEGRETDRRFQSIQDNKRGVQAFGYVHENDTLIFSPSEFCPKQRMYALPEGGAKGKVLEFHATDFAPVRAVSGGENFLGIDSSGNYKSEVQQFHRMSGTLIGTHAAAIVRLDNFTT